MCSSGTYPDALRNTVRDDRYFTPRGRGRTKWVRTRYNRGIGNLLRGRVVVIKGMVEVVLTGIEVRATETETLSAFFAKVSVRGGILEIIVIPPRGASRLGNGEEILVFVCLFIPGMVGISYALPGLYSLSPREADSCNPKPAVYFYRGEVREFKDVKGICSRYITGIGNVYRGLVVVGKGMGAWFGAGVPDAMMSDKYN